MIKLYKSLDDVYYNLDFLVSVSKIIHLDYESICYLTFIGIHSSTINTITLAQCEKQGNNYKYNLYDKQNEMKERAEIEYQRLLNVWNPIKR